MLFTADSDPNVGRSQDSSDQVTFFNLLLSDFGEPV